MNTKLEVVCSPVKIYKPKPRKMKFYNSNQMRYNNSIRKCPFDIQKELNMNNSHLKKGELFFKSCSIEDIEKDFALLKEKKIKSEFESDDFFSNSNCSTRPNSSEEDSKIKFYIIERPKNPFYKNFE